MATAKKRAGTLERSRDASGRIFYRAKIALQDGSRARVEIPLEKRYSESTSRNFTAFAQEIEDAEHTIFIARETAKQRTAASVAGPAKGTWSDWYDRYEAFARECGQTDLDKKRSRWRKWIAPRIGQLAIDAVTRDTIEDIRDDLDAAIAAWKRGDAAGKRNRAVSGKTAMNAWSALTSAMKAAVSSKRRDLRVRADNPCLGVEPPGDRDSRKSRRKTFLYPKEAAALLACDAIPIEWREVYALACYLYVRPGELRVLAWGDLDLDAGHVHVTKAWDYADAKIKAPKTSNGIRHVPIDPALAPLLARMAEGKPRDALVVPALAGFGEDHLAEQFRRHLRVAKVERAELHRSTRTHVQGNFRSCRDSGITWLALAGVPMMTILRRAGHDDPKTTLGYVKLAEDLAGDLGAPFPPLPDDLVAVHDVHRSVHLGSNSSDLLCRRRESNPAESERSASTPIAPRPEKTVPIAIAESTISVDGSGGESTPEPVREAGALTMTLSVDRVLAEALTKRIEQARRDGAVALAEELERTLDLVRGPNVVRLASRQAKR